jgi:N-methylhydantoinase A
MAVSTHVACRYLGQNYEQEVRMYQGHVDRSYELAIELAPDAPDFVARLAQRFHESHRTAYGYDLPDQPIQSVYLGATALVASPIVTADPYPGAAAATPRSVSRRILVAAGEWQEASIWKRPDLPLGWSVDGPAIIEEADSTTYVPPGLRAEVHPTWCLILQDRSSSGGAR